MEDTPFVKHDAEKLLYQLIPTSLHRAVGAVMTYGSFKYTADNWRKGTEWGRYYRAALGHLEDFWEGKDYDDESGLPVLWHAACDIAFLIEFFETGIGTDDRSIYKREDFTNKIKEAFQRARSAKATS